MQKLGDDGELIHRCKPRRARRWLGGEDKAQEEHDMNAIRCLIIAAAAFGLLTGVAGAAGKRAFKADLDSYQEVSALSTTGTGSFRLRLNAAEDEGLTDGQMIALIVLGVAAGAVIYALVRTEDCLGDLAC